MDCERDCGMFVMLIGDTKNLLLILLQIQEEQRHLLL